MKKLYVLTALGFILSVPGCGSDKSATNQSDASASQSASDQNDQGPVDHSVEGHAHGTGPHGGTIADWGGGLYHVEFTVDHDKQQATVYILGSDEKTASPIDSDSIELAISDPDMQVTLAAAAQDGDPEGKASRFVGTHEKLGIVQEYAGTMTGVVDGTPYSGDFSEQAHDH